MHHSVSVRSGALGGIAFSLASSFLFSSTDVIIKVLSARYPLFQLIAMQVAFASIPALFVLLRGGSLRRRPLMNNPALVIARGVLAGLGTLSGFYAFSKLPLAEVYAITFGAPLLVTLASIPLLGESVGVRRWTAVLVGFLGVLIMVRPGFETLTLGHLAAFATVFTTAGVVLIMRSIGPKEERGIMLCAVMLGLMAASWPMFPFVALTPSWGDLGLIALSGLIMGTAQLLTLEALRRASASTIAPMQYTMLLWALIYGVVTFGDPIKAHVLAGASVVIASSLYIMHRERVRAREG